MAKVETCSPELHFSHLDRNPEHSSLSITKFDSNSFAAVDVSPLGLLDDDESDIFPWVFWSTVLEIFDYSEGLFLCVVRKICEPSVL